MEYNFIIADDPLKAEISFYKHPITNVVKEGNCKLLQIAEYLKSDKAVAATKQLHQLKWQFDNSEIEEEKKRLKEEMRKFKAMVFDCVTFSGCFGANRTDAELIMHSGLVCLDFDHVGYTLASLKERLIEDKFFKALLLFTSPSGDGLKLVIAIDLQKCDHKTWCEALRNYFMKAYLLDADKACCNMSRTCFLPHDPNVYVAPEVIDPSAGTGPYAERFNEFDPLEWAGKRPEKLDEHKDSAIFSTNVFSSSDDDDLEVIKRTVEVVIEKVGDMTSGYVNWRDIAFALSDKLGEVGREIFHTLSKQNAQYNQKECDTLYDSALKGRGKGTHIGTFFQKVKDLGIDISAISREVYREHHAPVPLAEIQEELGEKCATCATVPSGIIEQNPIINKVYEENDESVPSGTVAQVAHFCSGQTFSDKLHREDIPDFLLAVIDNESDVVSQDKMLLGVLNIISGIMPESLYAIYDRKKIFAPLYNLIIGPYASSKGDLEACRMLIMPIKNELRRKYEAEKADYEEQKAQWDAKSTGKERAMRGAAPEEPVFRNPFISANSSVSAVYRLLDANGGYGAIFDTEADSMSNMLNKTDYGDYSDLLRKAFQHEMCTMVRVGDHINIEIARPRLAVFLTCTGSQVPKLLPPDNVANGLASRFLTYILPASKLEFRDVFARSEESIEDLYLKLGNRVLVLYHALLARMDKPIQFLMSYEQQKQFIDTFSDMLQEQFDILGEGIKGFIFRMALQCCRYAMVLTMLRRLSEREEHQQLFDEDEVGITCDERDFRIAMTIMECLVNHTGRLYKVVAAKENDPFATTNEKPCESLRTFFKALPDGREFKTKEAVDIAAQFQIAERTAKRLLGDMISKYQVVDRIKYGIYVKVPLKQPEA